MSQNLVTGTIWVNRLDGHSRGFVRIKRVEFDSVTYEINEKINDGEDYVMANWGFRGTLKTLSVEEFEAKYQYSYSYNLDHELKVARERMAAASELLISNIDLDTGEAEALVNLFLKTVLNEAAVRIDMLDWDTGCCGDDGSKASNAIEVELTAEEIEELDG